MKLKGVFGVPAIDKESGKEYVQPIPNVVVILRTDKGVEHTIDVDSFGYYSADIPVGDYGVQAYVKGNKQTLGYLRQGVHFSVTKTTKEGDFEEWLKIDTVNNPDPLLSQWTQLLKDIEKQRTEFANDIKDVVGMVEKSAEPVVQKSIKRVQAEADKVKVDVGIIIKDSQASLDNYLIEKKKIYDADLAKNIKASGEHLTKVTTIKSDIEKIQKDFNSKNLEYSTGLNNLYLTHSNNLNAIKQDTVKLQEEHKLQSSTYTKDLNALYTKHSKSLNDQKNTIDTDLAEQRASIKTDRENYNKSVVDFDNLVVKANADLTSVKATYLKDLTTAKNNRVKDLDNHTNKLKEGLNTLSSNNIHLLEEKQTSAIANIEKVTSTGVGNVSTQEKLSIQAIKDLNTQKLDEFGKEASSIIRPILDSEVTASVEGAKSQYADESNNTFLILKDKLDNYVKDLSDDMPNFGVIKEVDLIRILKETTSFKEGDYLASKEKQYIVSVPYLESVIKTSLVTKDEIDSIVQNLDLKKYATLSFVSEEISKIPKVDLKPYATKEDLNKKWDKQETVGNNTGKVMREGAYGLGSVSSANDYNLSIDYNIESSDVLQNGFYRVAGGSTGFPSHKASGDSLIKNGWGGTHWSALHLSLQNRLSMYSMRNDVSQGWVEFLSDGNTTTDKNGVIFTGSKSPIDTLNVSDMADTVINNDALTVTAGAVYRKAGSIESQIRKNHDIMESRVAMLHAMLGDLTKAKWEVQTTEGTGSIIRKSITDSLSGRITTAQNRADSAYSLATTANNTAKGKWDKQVTIGSGSIVRESELKKYTSSSTSENFPSIGKENTVPLKIQPYNFKQENWFGLFDVFRIGGVTKEYIEGDFKKLLNQTMTDERAVNNALLYANKLEGLGVDVSYEVSINNPPNIPEPYINSIVFTDINNKNKVTRIPLGESLLPKSIPSEEIYTPKRLVRTSPGRPSETLGRDIRRMTIPNTLGSTLLNVGQLFTETIKGNNPEGYEEYSRKGLRIVGRILNYILVPSTTFTGKASNYSSLSLRVDAVDTTYIQSNRVLEYPTILLIEDISSNISGNQAISGLIPLPSWVSYLKIYVMGVLKSTGKEERIDILEGGVTDYSKLSFL